MTDPAQAIPAVPKTILIVEDNSLNMKLFSDVLTSRGYRVIGTSSGLAAKQMAAEHLPDLILMDIQLSEVSGYEVIEAIKADEQTRAIPVIAVTAYAMREDERRVRSMGCASYISKPIFIGPFVREIEAVLAGGQGGGADDEVDPEDVDTDLGFFRRGADISVVTVPQVLDDPLVITSLGISGDDAPQLADDLARMPADDEEPSPTSEEEPWPTEAPDDLGATTASSDREAAPL